MNECLSHEGREREKATRRAEGQKRKDERRGGRGTFSFTRRDILLLLSWGGGRATLVVWKGRTEGRKMETHRRDDGVRKEGRKMNKVG
jgi:hypothetical protein